MRSLSSCICRRMGRRSPQEMFSSPSTMNSSSSCHRAIGAVSPAGKPCGSQHRTGDKGQGPGWVHMSIVTPSSQTLSTLNHPEGDLAGQHTSCLEIQVHMCKLQERNVLEFFCVVLCFVFCVCFSVRVCVCVCVLILMTLKKEEYIF